MLTSFLALTRVIYALNALACTRSAGWRSGIQVCSVGFTAPGKLQWYHLMQGYCLKRALCQWRENRCGSVSKTLCESSEGFWNILSLVTVVHGLQRWLSYWLHFRRLAEVQEKCPYLVCRSYLKLSLRLVCTNLQYRCVVFSMSNLLYLCITTVHFKPAVFLSWR